MERLSTNFFLPSAAIVVPRKEIAGVRNIDRPPQIGDLVYVRVKRAGQHVTLENKQGRCHDLTTGARFVGVFGNRYAPDFYEGLVPDRFEPTVDLMARSGVLGMVQCKAEKVIDPTSVRVRGYIVDKNGEVINTRNYCQVQPNIKEKKFPRARLILVVGTAMNAGKTTTAAACCWALSNLNYSVRASKVTGTASLKDILSMQDHGAVHVRDFSHFGWPSTYMLSEERILEIFNHLDLKYANDRRNYWVVEIADGVFQRETQILLGSEHVRKRIYRLVFAAQDAAGALGGVTALEKKYGLRPDAISGVCAGSPLAVRELKAELNIPVFNNRALELDEIAPLITPP